MPAAVPTPNAETTPAPTPPPRCWKARLAGLALFACGAGVLGTAVALNANAQGMGTHTQLGFAPCGFEASSGLPCATCGMTTSVTLAAHGQLRQAFVVQPAGALFALAMAMSVVVGGWALLTGRSLMPVATAIVAPRWLITAGVIVALAWGYRIIDALSGHPWTSL